MARLTPRRGVPELRHILDDPCDYDEDAEREIGVMHPEWSGVLQTYLPDPIFEDENGEDR